MIRFKEIRTRKGLTQAQVAEQLSISRASYTNIENGKRDPDTQTIQALSDLFGVSVDELLGRTTAYEEGTMAGLTLDEKRLVTEYRKLSIEGKSRVFDYVLMARNTYPAEQSGESDLFPGVEARTK